MIVCGGWKCAKAAANKLCAAAAGAFARSSSLMTHRQAGEAIYRATSVVAAAANLLGSIRITRAHKNTRRRVESLSSRLGAAAAAAKPTGEAHLCTYGAGPQLAYKHVVLHLDLSRSTDRTLIDPFRRTPDERADSIADRRQGRMSKPLFRRAARECARPGQAFRIMPNSCFPGRPFPAPRAAK